MSLKFEKMSGERAMVEKYREANERQCVVMACLFLALAAALFVLAFKYHQVTTLEGDAGEICKIIEKIHTKCV